MKNIFNLFAIIILVITLSCNKKENLPTPDANPSIYINSFESLNDTIGWSGYCSNQFQDEAAPNGGNQSIGISCGCIAPHTNFEIGPFDEDHDLILSCWGKSYGMGGSISLSYNDAKSIRIGMRPDSMWKKYQSKDTLFCPKGEKLSVGMSAGGIGYGEIIVDLLEVKRLN